MSERLKAVPRYEVCGVPVAALTPEAAAALIVDHAFSGTSLQTHLCNAYTLSLVDSDEVLREALLKSDLNLPDGTPVAWLGRIHGTQGPVRGPGLVGDVARAGVHAGLRHYLYGGAPGVAETMAAKLQGYAPGIQIVGTETPPYRDLTHDELAALTARISQSGAHIVWVGLGTPRQDYVVPQLAESLQAAVVPVGAAFDFWAGSVKQAPEWMHGSGLEWLYRFAAEPQRLWRRYVIGNPRFLIHTLRHAQRRAGQSQ